MQALLQRQKQLDFRYFENCTAVFNAKTDEVFNEKLPL